MISVVVHFGLSVLTLALLLAAIARKEPLPSSFFLGAALVSAAAAILYLARAVEGFTPDRLESILYVLSGANYSAGAAIAFRVWHQMRSIGGERQ